MKRLVFWASLVTLCLGCWLTAVFLLGTNGQTVDAPPQAAGVIRNIELDVDSGGFSELTDLEQLDQIRDWLLHAALVEDGASPEQIHQALFDLPPVRRDVLQSVSNLEFGVTRSAVFGDSVVVGLVPRDDSQARADLLADIADRARQSIGAVPSAFHVYEYAVDMLRGRASIKRLDPMQGADLFTEASGYHEVSVQSAQDIARFLEQTDDVVHARAEGGTVVLGGRRMVERARRPITLEDVAALWRSEVAIADRLNSFEEKWRRRPHATEAEVLEAAREAHLVDGSGFSLDPTFNYTLLARWFAWRFDAATTARLGLAPDEIDRVSVELGDGRDDALYSFLNRLAEKHPQEARSAIDQAEQCCQFQQARYDGELRGTEVGMTLFYCDLVAKLWGWDFADSTPLSVEGFIPKTAFVLPAMYRGELEAVPNTRLWFGPREDALQVRSDQLQKSLFLQRSATKVFSASSNSLTPGEEVPANAPSRRFLDWWNDHYGDVARYEPEYTRLDGIMKWSILIRWVRETSSGEHWASLQSPTIDVRRDRWFPEWVIAQRQLKFRDVGTIHFGRRTGEADVEKLERLRSRAFRQFDDESESRWYISGGVSLAPNDLLTKRAPVVDALSPSLRRGRVDYSKATGEMIETLSKTSFRLSAPTPSHFEVRALAEEGKVFSGVKAQLSRAEASRVMEAAPGGVRLRYSVGDTPVGNVEVLRTGSNFRLGWKGRDLDSTMALARRLAHEPGVDGMAARLANDASVAESFALKNGNFVVRLRASDRWVQLAPDSKPPANLSKEWSGRTGDLGSKTPSVNFKFVTADEARALQQQAGARGIGRAAPQGPVRQSGTTFLRDAAKAPSEGRALLRKQFGEALRDVDGALGRRDPGLLAHIDDLVDIYGSRPELLSRRAIAQLQGGDGAGAARTLNRAAERGGSVSSFYDELSAQLSAPGAADTRVQFNNMKRWVERNQRQALGRELALTGADDGIGVACGLPKSSTTRVITSAADFPAGQPIVYVQDSPGVYYRDWSLSTRDRLPSLLRAGKLEHLPAGDVSRYRPTVIYRVQEAGFAPRIKVSRLRPSMVTPRGVPTCDDSVDEDTASDACGSVILFSPNVQQADPVGGTGTR